MPRYFFHIHDDQSRLDREGTELADPTDARAHAQMLAGQIIADSGTRRKAIEDLRLEVTDDTGLILLRVDFVVTASPNYAPHEPTGRHFY